MTMAGWEPQRPCPIPGHPQDDAADDAPRQVTGTPWQRLRAWHLHAPAERLPLPAILLTWLTAWVLHWLQLPVRTLAGTAGAVTVATWLAWAWRDWRASAARHADPDSLQPQPRELFLPTEAALVAAAWGGWIAAAAAFGPAARPDWWPSLVYLAGATGGYWWLRRHQAVRAARRRRDQAAAELADKTRWHQILPRAGLGGWHMQWRRDTNLGEERLITTSPENALATRVAASSSAVAEKLAHILGLPYGRIDLAVTDYPGELIIGIRTVDLSVRDAAYHPMTTPWPDAEPSPFAGWFGETASIRDPVTWGFCPEDGSALTMQLFSAFGGRVVGVIGMTGSGKSNLLNNTREHVTRCADARMVQLNGAHMGDELTWEPLSAVTVCGPAATDETVRSNIAEALSALCLLVTNRSATLADTGHSTFQPTPDNPAVVVIIDEVDEIVKHVPGAGQALEFLAAKQRKSAVALELATQRAVVAALGGGAVRANMSEVLIGKVARATESRHASGAEKDIPDIREYARGAPGYFQRWDPHSGQVTGRGRAFLLGKPPSELAYINRLVETRRHLRDWSIPDMPPLPLEGGRAAAGAVTGTATQQIVDMRARLAAITQAATRPAPPGPAPTPAFPARLAIPPGVPQADGQILLRLLAEPDGVTAAAGGKAIGKSKSRTADYLKIFENRGIAVRTGSSRASRYKLAGQHRPASQPRPGPAPARPDGYVTIAALADAVHDGLVDADNDTRAVLEQARLIRDRPARRPHLAVVPDPESDAS